MGGTVLATVSVTQSAADKVANRGAAEAASRVRMQNPLNETLGGEAPEAPVAGFTVPAAEPGTKESRRMPKSLVRESADEHELRVLFRLLCSVVQWVERRENGTPTAVSAESFSAAMSHLGLHFHKSEVFMMLNHAEEGGQADGVQRDMLLEAEEFIRETADAQRDIHDADHSRSVSNLWRMAYQRLKLVDDSRRMRQTVLDLRGLFGTESSQQDRRENSEVAAQLVLDAVLGRNIYHKLNREGRSTYLRLHRLRYVFGAAVWANLLLGWVEDEAHEAHEWFGSVHATGKHYWLVPTLELFLLTPIHLYHCVLRIAVSVRWQNDTWLLFKGVAIAAILCDAAHELVAGQNTMPLSRLLRPYLLLDYHSPVRKLHMQCVRALRSLKELMVLCMICLLFFLLAGLMMFPTPGGIVAESISGQGHVRGTSQGGAVFTDVWQRLCQVVYLMFGAVNYPDIILPAYIEDGPVALAYFLPAIVIFLFCFVNILLAVVYSGYVEDRNAHFVRTSAKRSVALTLAFSAMDGQDGQAADKFIDRAAFDEFLAAFRRLELQFGLGQRASPRPGSISSGDERATEDEEVLWRYLEPTMHEGKEVIGPSQFLKLPSLLSSKQFQKGPGWALRGAQCELRGVRREDCRSVVGAEADDCHPVLDEAAAGDYRRLREISPREGEGEGAGGGSSGASVGDRVVVTKVRSKMGGEKILTQRLSKFKTIAANMSIDAAAGSAGSSSAMEGQPGVHKAAIWVGNIPSEVTPEGLTQIFAPFGTVVSLTLRQKADASHPSSSPSSSSSSSSSWAFVRFSDERSAQNALQVGSRAGGGGIYAGEQPLKVKPVAHDIWRSSGASRAAWRATVAPQKYKLDWTAGVPLVWRRQAEIHSEQEYVRFAGVIKRVNPDGTLDVSCHFDRESGSGKVPWESPPLGARGNCWERFLRGGLLPGLRELLLLPSVSVLTTGMIIASLVASFHQYVNRADIIAAGNRDTFHFLGDFIFCFFFTCEMGVKILAFGAVGYLASPWHRFDGVVSVCMLLSTFSLLWEEPRSNVPSHRYWQIVKLMRAMRVFRLLRVLSSLELRRNAVSKYQRPTHHRAASHPLCCEENFYTDDDSTGLGLHLYFPISQ